MLMRLDWPNAKPAQPGALHGVKSAHTSLNACVKMVIMMLRTKQPTIIMNGVSPLIHMLAAFKSVEMLQLELHHALQTPQQTQTQLPDAQASSER